MDITKISEQFKVRKIQEEDVPVVYQLCKGNPLFYEYCPPMVTIEEIREDMIVLPPGKTKEDKYYIGFWDDEKLIAVMDLILKYPNTETVFIGLFMMDKEEQGKGLGSKIITDLFSCLKGEFAYARLAYVNGNKQSEHFWKKNRFLSTGVVTKQEQYDLVVMEREL